MKLLVAALALLSLPLKAAAVDPAEIKLIGCGAAVGVALGLVLDLTGAVKDRAHPRRWTSGDTALELVFVAAETIDLLQTSSFRRKGWRELNPLLGAHPSQLAITGTTVGVLVVHAAIARLLPHPYRTYWQTIWIGSEISADFHNIEIHAGFSWPW